MAPRFVGLVACAVAAPAVRVRLDAPRDDAAVSTWRELTSFCTGCTDNRFDPAGGCSRLKPEFVRFEDLTPEILPASLPGDRTDIQIGTADFTCCCSKDEYAIPNVQRACRLFDCEAPAVGIRRLATFAQTKCGKWGRYERWSNVKRRPPGNASNAAACVVRSDHLAALSYRMYEPSPCSSCGATGFDPASQCKAMFFLESLDNASKHGDSASISGFRSRALAKGVPMEHVRQVIKDNLGKNVQLIRRQCFAEYRFAEYGPTTLSMSETSGATFFEQTYKAQSRLMHKLWNHRNFGIRMGEGVDSGGLTKAWIRHVFTSTVRPNGVNARDDGLGGLANGSQALKFLLEDVGGRAIPVWPNIYSFLARAGQLSEKAQERYHFLGAWLARAHVIEPSLKVELPFPLHPLIYDSIAAGKAVLPVVVPDASVYKPEHQIEACEQLKMLRGSYSDLGPYQIDAASSNTEAPSPLHASPDWGAFGIEWGVLALDGASSSADVPQEVAALFTSDFCKRLLLDRWIAPVSEIVAGFNSELPHTSSALCSSFRGEEVEMLLGGSGVRFNVEVVIQQAQFRFANPLKTSLFKTALRSLTQEELDRLMVFITNHGKPPVGGFAQPVKFVGAGDDLLANGSCRACRAHTCFNTLDVPTGCLTRRLLPKFVESLRLSSFGVGFGFE